MTYNRLISLSIRYFHLHFKRYIFLLVALSFGFGVITVLTSLKAGMEENVYRSAQSHYAGDIIVQGENKGSKAKFRIIDPEAIVSLIEQSDVKIKEIVTRTILGDGTIYFNGASIRQKYVLGVDWENEKSSFETLNYSSLQDEPFASGGILISSPVAKQLNAQLGDKITLQVKTRTGQVNTGSFIIQAIVKDNSIFGSYKCYLSRKDLNQLIRYKEKECSAIGIYLANGESIAHATPLIHSALKSSVDTAALFADRDELAKVRQEKWKGIRFFVLTLPVYLSEIADLLMAIELVSYFLYFLMLLIILVSVMVTYRLLLHEREKEIGTMRAIAFSGSEIIFMLMCEAFILFLLSLLTGFILAKLIVGGVSFLSFSWIPSFDIFMKDGKLSAVYTLRTTMINSAVVLAILLPAVTIPVYNTSRQPLASILTGGNK